MIRPLLEKRFDAEVQELHSMQEAIEELDCSSKTLEQVSVIVCDYHGTSVSLMKSILGFCQKVPCIFIVDDKEQLKDFDLVEGAQMLESVNRKYLTKELVQRISELNRSAHVESTTTIEQIEKASSHLDQLIAAPEVEEDDLRDAAESSLEIVQNLSEKLGFTPQIQALAMKSVELTLRLVGTKPRLIMIINRLKKNDHKYLSSHSIMLAELSCAIACKAGWNSAPTFLKLTLAAYLHDLALQDNLLAQCTNLDEAAAAARKPNDMNLFKLHPMAGAEFARKFHEIPPDVDTIIAQHHERADGTGFPRGLFHHQLSPLASLFIMAEDMLHYFLENEMTGSFEHFAMANGYKYQSGAFKKILKSLAS